MRPPVAGKQRYAVRRLVGVLDSTYCRFVPVSFLLSMVQERMRSRREQFVESTSLPRLARIRVSLLLLCLLATERWTS